MEADGLRDITLASEGDRAATTRLLAVFGSRLLKRIRNRLVLNPFADFSPEDVLQETSIDVFKGIQGLTFESEAAFHGWLNRVTDNRLAKMIRDRSRIKRGGPAWQANLDSSIMQLFQDIHDGEAETGSDKFLRQEGKEAVRHSIAVLPEQQRQAIEHAYFAQMPLEEIAAKMGLTKDAVRGLIFRAKKAMRDEMGNSSRWFK